MVDRNQLGPMNNLSSAPTPSTRRAAAATAKAGNGVWWLIGGFVLLLLAIGRCSSTGTGGAANTTAAQDAGAAQQAIGTAISAQRPPAVRALDKAAVRRGEAHMALAAAKEGLAGEMIYSQNCFDALAHAFAWAKLDACGAFDADAAQTLDDDPTTSGPETAWFQSETAAGRYLKAATSAGLAADAADARLADLQARVARAHKPKPKLTSTPTPSAVESLTPGDNPEGGDDTAPGTAPANAAR